MNLYIHDNVDLRSRNNLLHKTRGTRNIFEKSIIKIHNAFLTPLALKVNISLKNNIVC